MRRGFSITIKSLGREFIKRILSETDIVISRDTRQMGDWLAGGKYAISIFGPVSRMDLDLMQTQGLPVDWFKPDQLKEGTYITGGSGGVALINKAPHPNAAKVGLNWLLSREGQMAYQRLFTQGNDGPDSMRIDIPKDKVPLGNRRPGESTTDVLPSSTAPSGWTRSRSRNLSKKCWNSGRNKKSEASA